MQVFAYLISKALRQDIFLTRLEVFSRKVPNGLKLKASLSKGSLLKFNVQDR